MVCIYCETAFNSNFCPNCGEKPEGKRITFQSITREAFSTLTNMDKGFLFNTKMLFIDPKSITSHYISGKRKGILNPISFLILAVTIYLILSGLFRVPIGSDQIKIPEASLGKIAYAAGKYIRIYFKYFWITSIIPLSIATRLVFRKYNLTEHLAINSFVLGQSTLIGIVSYLIFQIEMVINPVVYITIVWLTYRIFVRKTAKITAFVETLVVITLFFLQLIVIAAVVGMAMANQL